MWATFKKKLWCACLRYWVRERLKLVDKDKPRLDAKQELSELLKLYRPELYDAKEIYTSDLAISSAFDDLGHFKLFLTNTLRDHKRGLSVIGNVFLREDIDVTCANFFVSQGQYIDPLAETKEIFQLTEQLNAIVCDSSLKGIAKMNVSILQDFLPKVVATIRAILVVGVER